MKMGKGKLTVGADRPLCTFVLAHAAPYEPGPVVRYALWLCTGCWLLKASCGVVVVVMY